MSVTGRHGPAADTQLQGQAPPARRQGAGQEGRNSPRARGPYDEVKHWTATGKAKSSRNAWKGGWRQKPRDLRERWARQEEGGSSSRHRR